MKLKSILLLLMLASPLILLPVIPVSAQPPAFIANAFITLTLGNPVARDPATSTIIGMGPTPPTANIVWFGEYEYLSTSGPPNPGGPLAGPLNPANPGMVPLFGSNVTRVAGPYGTTWYSVVIGPVKVAGVNVTVIKTVRLPLSGVLASLGYVQLDYQIIPNATIPELWLYYSIDYDDTPGIHCPNCDSSRVFSYEDYDNVVLRSGPPPPGPPPIIPPPAPMPTPPGGGILVDTEGSGWGYMGSWNWSYSNPPDPGWIPASTFNVWRYCGYWNRTLWPDWYGWPIGEPLPVCEGALDVNLGAVSPAGVRCNQLYIGGIFEHTIPPEPPIPPVPLTACFEFKDQWFTPQILVNVSEHSVRRVCPIAGRSVTFDASRSFDLNSTHTIISYEWDFGDGTPPFNTTVPTIDHTYPNLGYNYEVNVTLTVYNNASETAHARGRMIIAPPSGVDDVAVTNVVSSKTVVGQGFRASINVTVANQGNYTETFNVTLYANTTIIATLITNITLTSGNCKTIIFTWNTTGYAKGNYTISAYASPVSGETDTTDNTKIGGTVFVTVAGDVTGEGLCDMQDISILVDKFLAEPKDPRWDVNCDVNDDHIIDMADISIAVDNFLKDP